MIKKVTVLLLLFCPYIIFGQSSQGGKPFSFSMTESAVDIDEYFLPGPDIALLQKQDSLDEKNGLLRKVGTSIFVTLNLANSGKWTVLANGDRIWRLKLLSVDALALGVYYNQFWLPPGGKLFLYNADKTQLIGAFTEANNTESGLFATELIAGNEAILEYYEPSRCKGRSIISINEVAYVYRDFVFRKNTKDFGDSESCEVNVNCSEGSAWQNQKKGVARIFLKVGSQYAWCSGSMLNNEREDCVPYMLTADHCGDVASTADLTQWIFHFNYEASGCPNPGTEPTSNSLTGCTLKARGGNGGTSGSDFYLVQLTSSTTAINPYYNGWNKANTASPSGVSIHHPSGDIKKISTYTSALSSNGWNGSGLQSHWRVVWAATANGHGVTEGGSSGAPIFDNSGFVVGDLTGGSSYCTATSSPDFYGKFSYSWDQNGTTAAARLKDWLDPDNTGVSTVNGKFCSGASSVVANFSGTPTAIPVGGTVNFTDLSTGTPTSWAWTFNGGTPGTSNVQNPTNIQYNTSGIYTVSLTVSNGSGSDTETKLNYIVVGTPAPIANFSGTPTSIVQGGVVNFIDLSIGTPTSWSWTFAGGTPATSTDQNPTNIQYNATGLYTVTLTATNASGSHTETKINYINVGTSGSEKICDTLHFPLPGNFVTYSIRFISGVYGYISGNNGYSDKAKADYFTPTVPHTKLTGAYFRFSKAKKAGPDYNVPVYLWDNTGTGGAPGNIMASKTLTCQQIQNDINAGQMTYVEFNPPVELTSGFYLGIELPLTAGDTIVLFTNKNGQTMPGTAWEQWRDNKWVPYSDPTSWSYNLSHAIFPIMCKEGYGIIELNDEASIMLYPNPTSQNFTLDFTNNSVKEAQINVYNSMGYLVKAENYAGQATSTIDVYLTDCASGIYYVQIKTENATAVKKIQLIK